MKPIVSPTAYLLISHGSRDARPQEAMNRLADLVRKHLDVEFGTSAVSGYPAQQQSDNGRLPSTDALFPPSPRRSTGSTSLLDRPSLAKPEARGKDAVTAQVCSEVIVGTACLELSPLALRDQIYEFGVRLKAAGVRELKLLPVFLMSGVHVMEDIPAEVEAARTRLEGALTLSLCPHLGSHDGMAKVLADRLAAVKSEGQLLVAHGSRRRKGNQAIELLARRVGTPVAYWATAPDIETQVVNLMQQGCQRLTILPYFLFAGGITDAIAHRTEELAERFPRVTFRLLPMLGATEEVANMAIDLLR